MFQDNDLLTIKDIQEYMKIGKDKAYKICKLKGFPSIKIGNTYRVLKCDLDEWLNQYKGSCINV